MVLALAQEDPVRARVVLGQNRATAEQDQAGVRQVALAPQVVALTKLPARMRVDSGPTE
jgi:hypothetical protein